MSFHYWRNLGQTQKTHFVSLKNSYHGETLGALAVSDVALFRDTYAPLLMQSQQVMSPDTRGIAEGQTAREAAIAAAQALETHLAAHHAQTAALIVEPLVQGAIGMAMYHPEYLRRAREICNRYQVHLICDEIAVGFGRTGSFFASEQAGAFIDGGWTPDFLCLSKGITGGFLPLAVVLCTDTVFDAFYDPALARAFLHSHSYSGNPLACRAALAVLDLFDKKDVFAGNRQLADRVNSLSEPLRRQPFVQHFRQAGTTGAGMIWAFEVDSREPEFAQQLFAAGVEESVLLRPMGNTVYWMPPYCLSDTEVEHMVHSTSRALFRVLGKPCGL